MTFSGPFTSAGKVDAPGRRATAIAFAGAALALGFNLALALAILPALEHREREVPLELAQTSGGTAPLRVSAREVVVGVDAEGKVRLGGREVDLETLRSRLSDLVREGGDMALTLRADARAPHAAVTGIFAAARGAGIRDAAVLTVEDAPPQ